MIWPSYLDDAGIMAKSQGKGGQTLAQHTWQVLQRIGDQYRLHPRFESRIWNWLFWGGMLHDFGKAASGFQRMLAGDRDHEWVQILHRHEILSLAFVDWLFPKGHPDRPWILAVIAFHHKDMNTITDKYGGHIPLKQMDPDFQVLIKEACGSLAGEIEDQVQLLLWRWIDECALKWADELSLPIDLSVSLIDKTRVLQRRLDLAIFKALRELSEWRSALSDKDRLQAILCRGLIVSSDHAASADVGGFVALDVNREIALRPLTTRGFTPRFHQQEVSEVDTDSAILIAPTGSGKTEAALLWAAEQHRRASAARLFYTLPYQASMNAMADRLAFGFYNVEFRDAANETVTVQHSRAILRFYRDYMESDSGTSARSAAHKARQRLNRTRLHLYPVKVFSPYQMLSAAYSLKGYETLLTDYSHSLFIFDEIHAYDPKRLALIITMIQWLREYFDARFLVMTATLPPTVRTALTRALFGEDSDDYQPVRASPDVFAESRRHLVVRHEGDLLDYIDDIARNYHDEDKAILVCCNTVARAQQAYRALQDVIPHEDIKLLHGRFTGKDRSVKERWLLQRVGTGKAISSRRPTVFVATQVVEVSLDVDFDTLYTDPAPLEALLQRFGRVNRGRGAGAPLCDVHVFSQPFGEDESKPYDYRYVVRALDTLMPGPVDEALIDGLLAQVYSGELEEEWWNEYQHSAKAFKSIVLDGMQAFQSATDDVRKLFYELFDGRQILSEDCAEAYESALESGGYLAASEYLINVSNGQFHMMQPTVYDEYTFLTTAPYNAETGLDLETFYGSRDEEL